MELAVTILALLTGIAAGALFRFLQIPIPAPPNLAGIMGIVGLFVGYRVVEYFDLGIDFLALLGLK